MSKSKAQIATLVDKLLTTHEISSSPVNLEKIFKNLKIEIVPDNLDAIASGAAVIKGDKKTIIINSNQMPERQRFTLAHELGHLLLHGNSRVNVDKEVVGNNVFWRDDRSSHGTDQKEIEANYFAACLLMPRGLVVKEIRKLEINYIDDSILEKLAKKFQVSRTAMGIRLGVLGVI